MPRFLATLALFALACSSSTSPKLPTVTVTLANSSLTVDGANNFLLVQSATFDPTVTAQGCPRCPALVPLSPWTLSPGQSVDIPLPEGTSSATFDLRHPTSPIPSIDPWATLAMGVNYDGVSFVYTDTLPPISVPTSHRLTLDGARLLYDSTHHVFLDPGALLSSGTSAYRSARATVASNASRALTVSP